MTKTEVKGYKATMPDGRPWYRDTPGIEPYEVGKTYTYEGKLELCKHGLHFCKDVCGTFGSYLSIYHTRVFAVTAFGKVLSNGFKCCANVIRFDRELSPREILEALAKAVDVDWEYCVDCELCELVESLSYPADPLSLDHYEDVEYDARMTRYTAERRQQFLDAARELAKDDVCIKNALIDARLLEDIENGE